MQSRISEDVFPCIITEDTFGTIHFFQRVSVAIQRGNAVFFTSTSENE